MTSTVSLPRIDNANVTGKKVFIRTDFGAALDNRGEIAYPSLLKRALPTLELLLNRGASLIIGAHAGTPGKASKNFSLEGLAELLKELLGRPVEFNKLQTSADLEKLGAISEGEVVLLENLLLHKGEEKNAKDFAGKLSSLADIYVNEAFEASSHNLASMVTLPGLIPSFAGLSLYKEFETYDSLFSRDHRPLVMVLGGIDLEGKVPFLKKIIKNLDNLLLGGGLVYTFLKSRAIPIGNSLFNAELQVDSFQIIEKAELEEVALSLPLDFAIAREFSRDAKSKVVAKMGIPDGWQGLDIGPKTLSQFEKVIKKAGTIFWYGPMGAVELDAFKKGSLGLAKAMSKSKARTIITGESTVAILEESGFGDKIDHVSRSSASVLKILEGRELPGIAALKK